MKTLHVDLTTYTSAALVRLRRNLQKLQRFGGGYQKMLGEIDAELAKPNRPADKEPEPAA